MTRRNFVWASMLGLIAQQSLAAESCDSQNYQTVEEYYDVISSWRNNPIILKAEEILSGQEVSGLYARERSHEHELIIPAEQMQKLKQGETIVVTTEIANGHSHTIYFDPNNIDSEGTLVQVKKRVSHV